MPFWPYGSTTSGEQVAMPAASITEGLLKNSPTQVFRFIGHCTGQVPAEAQTKGWDSLQCNSRLNNQFQKAHCWLGITMFYGIWSLKLYQLSEHHPFQCLDKSRVLLDISCLLDKVHWNQKNFYMLKVWKIEFTETRIRAYYSPIAKKRAKYHPLEKETTYTKSEKCSLRVKTIY